MVPTELVLSEGGDRIQSNKRCALKNKQDGVFIQRQENGQCPEP
jgi:hypothetical protein